MKSLFVALFLIATVCADAPKWPQAAFDASQRFDSPYTVADGVGTTLVQSWMSGTENIPFPDLAARAPVVDSQKNVYAFITNDLKSFSAFDVNGAPLYNFTYDWPVQKASSWTPYMAIVVNDQKEYLITAPGYGFFHIYPLDRSVINGTYVLVENNAAIILTALIVVDDFLVYGAWDSTNNINVVGKTLINGTCYRKSEQVTKQGASKLTPAFMFDAVNRLFYWAYTEATVFYINATDLAWTITRQYPDLGAGNVVSAGMIAGNYTAYAITYAGSKISFVDASLVTPDPTPNFFDAPVDQKFVQAGLSPDASTIVLLLTSTKTGQNNLVALNTTSVTDKKFNVLWNVTADFTGVYSGFIFNSDGSVIVGSGNDTYYELQKLALNTGAVLTRNAIPAQALSYLAMDDDNGFYFYAQQTTITNPAVTTDVATTAAQVTTAVEVTTAPVTTKDITTSPVTTKDITTSPVTTKDITTSPLTTHDITTAAAKIEARRYGGPVTTVLRMITRIHFNQPTVPTPDSSKSRTGLIVGLVIGGVVLLAAVVGVVYYMRNKKRAAYNKF